MDEQRIGAEERGMDIEVGEEEGRVGDEVRKVGDEEGPGHRIKTYRSVTSITKP